MKAKTKQMIEDAITHRKPRILLCLVLEHGPDAADYAKSFQELHRQKINRAVKEAKS